MRPQIQLAVALGAVLFLGGCATPTKNTSRTFTTVVIDPGHGGRDSGASGRYAPPEKFVTLDVGHRVDKKLRESQLETVMTRSNDTFVSLNARVAMGNAKPKSIFVSIHFNDARARRVHGFETYYYSPYAYDLAFAIERNLLTIRGAVNRGVHPAGFRVLRNSIYPSVLIECGFLSNRTEGRETRSEGYRELLADKIAEAIVDYRYGAGTYRQPLSQPSPTPAAPFGAIVP
jgi:N-acetylmuramoyl-L-alanine amidase